MVRSVRVDPAARAFYGDRWADQAERCLRWDSVMYDPTLVGELGLRALAALAGEYMSPDFEVARRLHGYGGDYRKVTSQEYA